MIGSEVVRKAHTTELNARAAVTRLKAMLGEIEPEVKHAISVEASLEAVNKMFEGDLKNVSFNGSACITIVKHVMSLNLAMTVAKIYERPSPQQGRDSIRQRRIRRWDKSDIASVPLIVRLLRHGPCQDELILRAREWTTLFPDHADLHEADCSRAIKRALDGYMELVATLAGRRSLAAVEDLRHKALAHNITSASIKLPRYNELFALVDYAKLIVGEAMLCVEGKSSVFEDVERHAVNESAAFWQPALTATVQANRWDREL